MGTLVLDEAWWKEQFKGAKQFMPGMETAESAAQTLVKKNPEIYFGCPFCAYREKNMALAKQHVEEHATKLLSLFTVKE
jgi:hypothetical protein